MPRARFPLAIFLGALLLVLGTPAAPAEENTPAAETLLARSIEYHDPEGRFLSRGHHLWFLETRPGKQDRRSEVVIDLPGQRFEMIRGDEPEIAGVKVPGRCEMTLDGRSEVTEEEKKTHRLSCERLTTMADYYTYLWGLPMKLRDPGTVLGRVTATTFEDRPVYDLRVTYEASVGEDIWYFYFDRETFALVGYRFYHDEAKNDGEVIFLEGEVAADGLRIPKSRTWVTHLDDRTLGTDTLVGISVLKEP